MRSTRFLGVPLVLATLALQGCSSAPRDTRAAYEPVTDITASATPMARIAPEAGEVVSVLQNRAGGVLTQRIVLKGDASTGGENAIVIRVNQGPRRMGDIDGPVPKPTQSSIQAELDESFAAVDMAMSQSFNHNSFGPFGYAIGHPRANSTCIYAWQWSLGRPPRIIDSPGAVASAASMPSAPTSVRVRLCRANMDEAQLVALMRDLQVFPPNSGDPYVDPAFEGPADVAGRDALMASGAPGSFYLGPRAAKVQVADAEPASRHAHARRRVAARHVRRHARLAAREDAAEPGVPIVRVPLPGGPQPSAALPSGAVNPLLAPLQGEAARRPTAVADEMPLPGRTVPPPHAARADPKPLIAPVPMPD